MSDRFDWDVANIKHILEDHPERNNTVKEVESVFKDENFVISLNKFDELFGEQRYGGVGVGTSGDEKFVVFVLRGDKIRPISCRRANKKERVKYYESIIKKL